MHVCSDGSRKLLQERISVILLAVLWNRLCLELTVVSSNFLLLLLLQDKGPTLSRVNMKIVLGSTVWSKGFSHVPTLSKSQSCQFALGEFLWCVYFGVLLC